MKVCLRSIAILIFTCFIAQAYDGRVLFYNDFDHRVYVAGDTLTLPEVGGIVNLGSETFTLVADLYAGTSASMLQRVATAVFDNTHLGLLEPMVVTLPWPGGDIDYYFKITVHETADQPYKLWGTTDIFTAHASSTIAPSSLVNPGLNAFSTWAPEPIIVDVVPEPAFAALSVMAAGAMVVFRRKAGHHRPVQEP